MALLVVLGLAGADTLALKEKASVGGPWVRMVDLLDAGRTDPAVRLQLADVYLGRAPEAGSPRIITQDEIRRELSSRGLDPAKFDWRGDRVLVESGPSRSGALREKVAAAIKHYLLAHESGLRSDEVSVAVVQLVPESDAPACTVIDARPSNGGYVAALSDGSRAEAVARIRRIFDTPIAARDLEAGKPVERDDLEIARIELAEEEHPLTLASLLGATPAVRIRRGSRITASDLRLRAAVKRGEVVRAVSSGYEVDARALEDGAVGQDIALEFVGSRNRFRAVVANPSRVDVVEGNR